MGFKYVPVIKRVKLFENDDFVLTTKILGGNLFIWRTVQARRAKIISRLRYTEFYTRIRPSN